MSHTALITGRSRIAGSFRNICFGGSVCLTSLALFMPAVLANPDSVPPLGANNSGSSVRRDLPSVQPQSIALETAGSEPVPVVPGAPDGAVSLGELTRKLDQLKGLVAELENITRSLQASSTAKENSRKIPAAVESSKAALAKIIRDNFPRKDGGVNNVLQDLDSFSGASEHSPEVRIKTIDAISKIISAQQVSTPLAKDERLDVAADMIENVAFPTVHVNQLGSTGTVACLEVRVASLHPDKYAEFVQELVTRGAFQLGDGHSIKFPALSWTHERALSRANHASRIFQLGATNLVWQTETQLPAHLALETGSGLKKAAGVDRGSVHFVMDGEQASLRHYAKGHTKGVAIKKGADGTLVETPALNPEQLERANSLITGCQEIIGFQRTASATAKQKGWMEYRDREELQQLLEAVAQFKETDARFPLMLNAEVNLSSKKASASHDNYCSIIHYDPATSKVDIDRTSGFHRDFVYEKALTLLTLWDELQ